MRANGLAASNKDLVKEINTLKAQLKKLSAAMEGEAGDGASRALDAADAGPMPAAWRAASAARPSCPSTSAHTSGTPQWAWMS